MANPPEPKSFKSGVQKYGIEGNKILNAINWTIQEDSGGNLSGTAEYHYDYKLHQRVPDLLLPKRGDFHPYDTRLQANQINQTYGANGVCKVTVQYVGISGWTSTGEDIGELTWELTAATSDESIDTHPNFFFMGVITPPTENTPGINPTFYSAVSDTQRQQAVNIAYTNTGLLRWDRRQVEVDSNQKFVGFKNTKRNRNMQMAGVRAFKSPQAVCRVNFSSTSTARYRWIMDNLGRFYGIIPFSEVASAIGSSKFDDGRNWLMTNAGVSKYQGVYKYQVEFTLSGVGGWNPYVYKEGANSNQ